jgi:hypothetical protein
MGNHVHDGEVVYPYSYTKTGTIDLPTPYKMREGDEVRNLR